MTKGYVEIIENTDDHGSCNCCSTIVDNPRLWNVKFIFGNHTTLIKMCENHLRELRNEIDKKS